MSCRYQNSVFILPTLNSDSKIETDGPHKLLLKIKKKKNYARAGIQNKSTPNLATKTQLTKKQKGLKAIMKGEKKKKNSPHMGTKPVSPPSARTESGMVVLLCCFTNADQPPATVLFPLESKNSTKLVPLEMPPPAPTPLRYLPTRAFQRLDTCLLLLLQLWAKWLPQDLFQTLL